MDMWLWVVIGIIGACFIYMITTYKHKHRKPRIAMILLLIVVLFLVSTIYFVSKANHIDMTTASGFTKGMGVYGMWLLQSANNMRSLSGYAVAMDWKGTNSSTSSVKTTNLTNINNTVKTTGSVDKPVPVSTKNKMVPKPLK
jgi:hypothetical protein